MEMIHKGKKKVKRTKLKSIFFLGSTKPTLLLMSHASSNLLLMFGGQEFVEFTMTSYEGRQGQESGGFYWG